MTAPACGSCTAPVPDGYLCQGCTRDLAELLLTAASIATDLDDAVARLLKRGNGGPRSDTEAPLPWDEEASWVRAQLRIAIVRCIKAVGEPPGLRVDGLIQIEPGARWLLAHLTGFRQLDSAAERMAVMRIRVRDALAVIDRKPERAPAGTCDGCGAQLLAELGADTVTCRCGTVTLALQDKRRERAAAADVLGTAAEISGALERIGIHVPRGTITSWASRGRLTPRPGGVYALSDVLALHAQSQARAGRP